MRASTVWKAAGVTAGLLGVAGCVGSSRPDYVTACMFETSVQGAYEYGDAAVPVVTPGEGGTAEGAAALNACIQRKAGAAGTVASAPALMEQSRVETTGGQTVRTYTYGQPPQSAPTTTPARPSGETCRRGNVLSGGSGYFSCNP